VYTDQTLTHDARLSGLLSDGHVHVVVGGSRSPWPGYEDIWARRNSGRAGWDLE
jgi:hypothetical protein